MAYMMHLICMNHAIGVLKNKQKQTKEMKMCCPDSREENFNEGGRRDAKQYNGRNGLNVSPQKKSI